MMGFRQGRVSAQKHVTTKDTKCTKTDSVRAGQGLGLLNGLQGEPGFFCLSR
jgi:hypothetical protein